MDSIEAEQQLQKYPEGIPYTVPDILRKDLWFTYERKMAVADLKSVLFDPTTRARGTDSSRLRIPMWPNIVRIGTMKMPLAIPSIPPKALTPTDMANSHS